MGAALGQAVQYVPVTPEAVRQSILNTASQGLHKVLFAL